AEAGAMDAFPVLDPETGAMRGADDGEAPGVQEPVRHRVQRDADMRAGIHVDEDVAAAADGEKPGEAAGRGRETLRAAVRNIREPAGPPPACRGRPIQTSGTFAPPVIGRAHPFQPPSFAITAQCASEIGITDSRLCRTSAMPSSFGSALIAAS